MFPIENHNIHDFQTSKFPLFFSEISMQRKFVFSHRKRKKCKILMSLEFKILILFLRTYLVSHHEPHKTWLWKIKIFKLFTLLLGKFFGHRKRKKCKIHMSLEFEILILFLKKKWWVTSNTTKNMNLKHQNFQNFHSSSWTIRCVEN
jgi:uncharacterized membrane protein (UPF0127 family)